MNRKLLLILILLFLSFAKAQNTVGTTFINENVFDAYTLFTSNTKSFLINNCGEVINEWNSTYLPGNAVYLLPNGNLLRAGRLDDGSSNITFGGQGGIIELFDWDSNLLWSYTYSSNQFRQHHDIFPMPNGNVLILAATVMSETEAIAEGRDPNLLTQPNLYSEQIIEVEPVGTNQGNIVWEWNAKDHLIQDFDNTKTNFGNVALTPEKIDINFLNGLNGVANWLHFNSIQYNENLDQVVMSSRHLSEVYVIDHSTTTAEAATSSGGVYGKGGDLLYRWGNPQAYKQGTELDRTLFGQHYPHFIADGLNNAGKLMIFNNGDGRNPVYSEAIIVTPPTTATGVYQYTPNTAFGPLSVDYSYSDQSTDPSEFYSAIVSSAQQLPNGNILICEGRQGDIFEIDNNDSIVWKYRNPVNNTNGNVDTQGDIPNTSGILFRAIKYALDFPAFAGRELTPGTPIELNPDLSACENLSVTDVEFVNVNIYPNPASNYININSNETIDKIELYSILGQKVLEARQNSTIDISAFKSGMYFVKIYSGDRSISKKIIKN
ncbi:aryl-sulfate sulfotransferase [Psychroserpens luteus]|uniref:Aryl-sulfate sulfotransferase n=1 Tax=Psychroserpens luteus TaxID=1434066 RepID=A0ABW5ZQU7_9FLAO|nr:aryl-sulfate sulfotransferase [Psychroserpens luteus]